MACWQGNKWYRISSNFSLIIAMFSSLKLEIETVNPQDIAQYHTSSCQTLRFFHKYTANPLAWHLELTDSQGCLSHLPLAMVRYLDKHNYFDSLHQIKIRLVWNPWNPDTGFRDKWLQKCHLSSMNRKRVRIRGLRLNNWSAPGYVRQDELCSEGKAISYSWGERYASQTIILD